MFDVYVCVYVCVFTLDSAYAVYVCVVCHRQLFFFSLIYVYMHAEHFEHILGRFEIDIYFKVASMRV